MTNQFRCKSARVTAHLVSLLFLIVTLSTANAQSINPSLDDVFQARLGPFFANFDTTVNIQGSAFDQEDLGDNKTVFAGYARWRITPKLHLNFGYSQLSSDSTVTTSQPIGGIPGTAGTTLNQDYETSSLPIALSYAFVKKPKTEFGIEAGVSITSIKNIVSVTVPGAPTITPVNQDITEPLPSIGLFWNQAFSPQWMLTSSFRYLPLEIGDLDAKFYDAFLGVEWRPWKNVGIGAAYLYTQADGNITSNGSITAFDYQYDGPFLYLMFGGGKR